MLARLNVDPRHKRANQEQRMALSEDYGQRFGGIGRLYGQKALERLASAHVCVVGIGGVGSWAVEALARSGVGRITMIDLDDVCVTNTNRQLHALDGNIGQPKAEVVAQRVRLINPECQVEAVLDFFTERTAEALLDRDFDYVIDAIDQPRNKCLLLRMCRERGLGVVTVGGAGGRCDPSRVKVTDLTRSESDGLLRKVRKALRQKHGFPRGRRRWKMPCVYSDEPIIYPSNDGGVCAQPEPGSSLRLDCNSGFGTATFVTGTFGFMAASVAINALTQDLNDDPQGSTPTP